MSQALAQAVAERFSSAGGPVLVERHLSGHIHDTWFASTRYGNFVLQRLNDAVFSDCILVMDNLQRVVHHLELRVKKSRLSQPERRVLRPLRAEGGLLLVYDDDGRPWRAFRKVDRASTRDEAYQIGRGFGRFLADVQDLPGRRLPEPIPGFKDFELRRQDFELVIEADPYERVANCRPEIDAIRGHRKLIKELAVAWNAGQLPDR